MGARGPWAHQAHITNQHAPQLRKLVQAVFAEEPSKRGHAWIVADLKDRSAHLVQRGQGLFALIRVYNHRGELVSSETPSAVADDVPLVEHREARSRDLDSDC